MRQPQPDFRLLALQLLTIAHDRSLSLEAKHEQLIHKLRLVATIGYVAARHDYLDDRPRDSDPFGI